ncbi:MAG: carboxypeptidase regulatory-like domain-containing protein [Planctomycetes bacterium]|nr:carboxypeptidase regulatory-like domain-containing protein [Planctomycetota bacterium]
MLRNTILGLGAATLFATATSAQFCSDNLYPLHLVDAAGNVVASSVDPATGETVYQFSTEAVYVAFDPSLASGTYYLHVTDRPIDGFDEVVSTNDPMDRFVNVTNTGGVITLSLPFTNNQVPTTFGLGLGGQGQSILLTFRSSEFSPCKFYANFGNAWDLTNGPDNPYLLAGGVNPTTGECIVRSYEAFAVDDGDGSDVTGIVFADADRDGVRDPGEGPLAGWEVQLVTDSTSVSAVTDADGRYRFQHVAAGSYSVELVLPSGYIATTAGSYAAQVCACADLVVQDFGGAVAMLPCDAKPLCYWYSYHGLCKIQQFGVLPTLPALQLVNTCGQRVAPGNLLHLKWYLLFANSWNMGYALSAQVTAMHANLMTGKVHPACVLRDPCLGTMTVAQLMEQAVASLAAHPYTSPWSSHRSQQSKLKNALLRANHNWIWQ